MSPAKKKRRRWLTNCGATVTPRLLSKADVSNEEDVAKMFEAVREEFGTSIF